MSTVAQLSMDAALAGRDLALEQLQESVPDWIAYAKGWLREYLRTHATVHADDVWAAGLVEPKNGRALGGVFQWALWRGLMVNTGEYRPSVHSHGSVKAVYASRIYEGE